MSRIGLHTSDLYGMRVILHYYFNVDYQVHIFNVDIGQFAINAKKVTKKNESM